MPAPFPPLRLHSGPSAHEQLTRRHPRPVAPVRLPAPSGPPPYRLRLEEVLSEPALLDIERAGELRFHCVGDTGGFHNPGPQLAVASAMATELEGERPVRFFYHLGDIVYQYGERAHYGQQFFDPYAGYRAPILAIAGNHDGDVAPDSKVPSLDAFASQFCAPTLSRLSHTAPRRPEHQPNVYWTLEHHWVTMIGLYSGVAEGGQIEPAQLRWLTDELYAARPGVTLILALHHPVFSADRMHGSNLALRDDLDRCFAEAGRAPDAVFSAHAHNYQRFSRVYGGRTVPYLVAGSGGFHELHGLGSGIPDLPASFAALPDLTLEAFQHAAYGFTTVSCGPKGAEVDYSMVVRRRPSLFDSVAIVPAV